ncbi:tumor necrosis factor receptor superfamily member 6 [Tiliqua scincoides]|uniref:tumor necrosis factor receptor superfamily member 6 n=1 Tax=Tiliqua scincoides TaxID=71010 RepID=UPI003462EC14
MSRWLLLALLALPAALDLIAAESSHVPNATPERTCSEGKGLFEDVCCDFCPHGKVVHRGCTETSPTSCKDCIKGAEYMDHPNLSLKCRRCSLCDTEHGLEVEENCTIYQNVKCRCKPGFFCSSDQCRHCDPCDKCEEGTIEEECTLSKNTVCTSKRNLLWLCALIPIVPVTAFLIWYCYRSNRSKKGYSVPQHPGDDVEMEIRHFPDIDLSPHISDIATEMTREQVMMFIRRLKIPQGIVDALVQDNLNNTAELKIALLQKWYEQNGVKGAHKMLITTLRELKFHHTADKIEQKIKIVISDSPDIR